MDLIVPAEASMVHVVVAFVQIPWGYLVSTSITVGVRHRMILSYLDTILKVHPIEVILDANYGVI